MHTIRSHFEDTNNRGVSSTKAWAATRAYVYFAADTLSLKQAQEVLDFLSSICPASTAKKVVQVAPPVLTKDVSKFLAPASEHFINVLGNEAFQKEIDDDPQRWLSNVKSYHSEVAWNKLVRHLSDDWGISSRAINKLKASTVAISTESTARINASLTYLDSVMDTEWLEKRKKTTSTITEQLIMRRPAALLLDTKTVLKPRVEYLMRRLNMTETDFTVFMNRGGGGTLTYSSEDKIRPMLEYLRTMLNQQELKNCVMRMPLLLNLAIETLQSRVEFFDDIERRHFTRWSSHTLNVQQGVEERSLAVCILTTGPPVFCLDFSTNVQPKIDFISKVWGEASLIQNLRQFPRLIGLNVESNLKPTLDFYNRTGYVLLSDDWEICQQDAALSVSYVAVSLNSRLLPRWYFVRSQNPSYRPSLSSICTNTDADFCKCAGLDLEQYLEFKKEHGPALELPDPSDLQLDE